MDKLEQLKKILGRHPSPFELMGYKLWLQISTQDKQRTKEENGGPGSGNHGHAGRPGRIGGSGSGGAGKSGPNKQAQEIKSAEDRIRKNNYETFVAVDSAGKVILDKKGEKSEVIISKDEIEKLSNADGLVFTHNHPSSNSFSLPDMAMGGRIHAKEIRITSKLYDYSLKPSLESQSLISDAKNNWPHPENIDNVMKESGSLAYDELVPKVQAGDISGDEASLIHTHRQLEAVAKTFKMQYTRKERK